jgi:hypothetical protein
MAQKGTGQVQLGGVVNKLNGFVLNDFLDQVNLARRAYKLPNEAFGLERIEGQGRRKTTSGGKGCQVEPCCQALDKAGH